MLWRNLIAVVAGMIAGGVAVMLIESPSMFLHPLPPNLDMNNKEAMAAWIQSLPISAVLIVVAAWGVGSIVATAVARRIASERASGPAVITSLIFLAAVIFNLATIPHPIWMWPVGIGVSVLGGLVGFVIAAPKCHHVTGFVRIRASSERVFQTMAKAEQFTQAIPEISKIEFLTEQTYGVGTKIRETRVMNGRTATVDLIIREQVENSLIRLESCVCGTVWSTLFSLQPAGNEVELRMQMEAIPHSFLAKLMTPMLLGMIGTGIQKDLERVREFCERSEKG